MSEKDEFENEEDSFLIPNYLSDDLDVHPDEEEFNHRIVKHSKPAQPRELRKLSDIIVDIEKGLSYKQIAEKYGRGESTVWTWVRKLREAGYIIKNKRGRKHLKI